MPGTKPHCLDLVAVRVPRVGDSVLYFAPADDGHPPIPLAAIVTGVVYPPHEYSPHVAVVDLVVFRSGIVAMPRVDYGPGRADSWGWGPEPLYLWVFAGGPPTATAFFDALFLET